MAWTVFISSIIIGVRDSILDKRHTVRRRRLRDKLRGNSDLSAIFRLKMDFREVGRWSFLEYLEMECSRELFVQFINNWEKIGVQIESRLTQMIVMIFKLR